MNRSNKKEKEARQIARNIKRETRTIRFFVLQGLYI